MGKHRDMSDADYAQEVRQNVADFLRYNNFDYIFDVHLESDWQDKQVLVYAGKSCFGIYLDHLRGIANAAERRMVIWKALCDADFVENCNKELIAKLEAATAEYEEILATQEVASGL